MSAGQPVHRLSIVIASLLLAAAGASPAWGQPTPNADNTPDEAAAPSKPALKDPKTDQAWLEKSIAQMDSDDFAARDKACADLANDDRLTLPLLEKRLNDQAHPLTPEQVLRLSEAGLKIFAGSQRGAMGVSFALTDGAVDGVKVGGAVEGFDAKRVLKPGDVIREMDGVSLAVDDQLRSRNLIVALIISHDPGEEIVLNLARNGEPVVVRLKLGNYRDLRNANELDLARLRMAWDMRRRRAQTTIDEAQGAEAGLSVDRWNQISDPIHRLAAHQIAQQRQNNPLVVVSMPQQPAPDNGANLLAAGASRNLLAKPEDDFTANERTTTRFVGQVQQIQMQIDRYNSLIKIYQRQANDPNIPDDRRKMLKSTINTYQQTVRSLRDEKKRLVGIEP